jgi:hypothetical protein
MIDTRPLKVKALECAIRSIKNSVTPKAANHMYLKWTVFHEDPQFKKAIEEKKLTFKK